MRLGVLFVLLCSCAFAQTPVVGGILNAFSSNEAASLSPGLQITIVDDNLGPNTFTQAPKDVIVNIGGKAAYVISATKTTINAQLPVDLPVGGAQPHLYVEYRGERSNLFTTPSVVPVSPAIAVAAGDALSQRMAAALGPESQVITPERPARPAQSVTIYATGLGPTDPQMVTGVASTGPARTTNPVTVKLGERTFSPEYAGAAPGLIGTYQVTFKVPDGVEGGLRPLTIEVAGALSQTVTLPVSPMIRSVVNAASFSSTGGIAPGTIVELYGGWMGSTDKLTGFPATEIERVSVLVNDAPVPLFRMLGTIGRVAFLMPYNARENGTVQLRLKTPDGTSLPATVTLTEASPGMFTVTDGTAAGLPYAAATRAGSAHLAIPRAMAERMKIPSDCANVNVASYCGEPIRAGESLQIYATGLGRATVNGSPTGAILPTGDLAPASGDPLYLTVAKPEVAIGGISARVDFSGLTPGAAGLYQINVVVPASAPTGDDVPIVVTMPNRAAHTSRIAIR